MVQLRSMRSSKRAEQSRAEQQQQLGGCEGAGADEHAENSWMPLGKIMLVG